MNINPQSTQLNSIYQSIALLNIDELDQLMQEITSIRRKKMPNVLSDKETELLKKINMGAPAVIAKRYNHLIRLMRKTQITEAEYQELLDITPFMESMGVKRLEYLVELASLRNQSLDALIEQLQLKPKVYVA